MTKSLLQYLQKKELLQYLLFLILFKQVLNYCTQSRYKTPSDLYSERVNKRQQIIDYLTESIEKYKGKYSSEISKLVDFKCSFVALLKTHIKKDYREETKYLLSLLVNLDINENKKKKRDYKKPINNKRSFQNIKDKLNSHIDKYSYSQLKKEELKDLFLKIVASIQHIATITENQATIEKQIDRLNHCMKPVKLKGKKAVYYDRATGEMIKSIHKPCLSKLCPNCNALRYQRLQKKYTNLIVKMDNPKLLTLTIKNPKLLTKHIYKKLNGHWKELRKWLIEKHKLKGGIYATETTYNEDEKNWHPHKHIVLDWVDNGISNEFMQNIISKKWLEITKDSHVIDFRDISKDENSIKELIKYGLKYQENIPYDEYLLATKGLRLIQTFGSCYKLERERGEEIGSNDEEDELEELSDYIEEVGLISAYFVMINGELKTRYAKFKKYKGRTFELVLVDEKTGEIEDFPDHLTLEYWQKQKYSPPIDPDIKEKEPEQLELI